MALVVIQEEAARRLAEAGWEVDVRTGGMLLATRLLPPAPAAAREARAAALDLGLRLRAELAAAAGEACRVDVASTPERSRGPGRLPGRRRRLPHGGVGARRAAGFVATSQALEGLHRARLSASRTARRRPAKRSRPSASSGDTHACSACSSEMARRNYVRQPSRERLLLDQHQRARTHPVHARGRARRRGGSRAARRRGRRRSPRGARAARRPPPPRRARCVRYRLPEAAALGAPRRSRTRPSRATGTTDTVRSSGPATARPAAERLGEVECEPSSTTCRPARPAAGRELRREARHAEARVGDAARHDCAEVREVGRRLNARPCEVIQRERWTPPRRFSSSRSRRRGAPRGAPPRPRGRRRRGSSPPRARHVPADVGAVAGGRTPGSPRFAQGRGRSRRRRGRSRGARTLAARARPAPRRCSPGGAPPEGEHGRVLEQEQVVCPTDARRAPARPRAA